MIYVILAAGLSTNFIIVALLFRRERQLSRQLSDMRAERNSEWILHALKGVPEEPNLAAPAADGTGLETQPQPVRRKRHLGLYIGGLSGIAAAVTDTTRHAWRTHRPQLIASAAAATLVVATAIVLIIVERQADDEQQPPSSAPTVTYTVTRSTSSTPAPAHPPVASPSATAGPSASASPTTFPPAGALPTSNGGASGPPLETEHQPPGTASSGDAEPSPPPSSAPPPSNSATPSSPPSTSPALCLRLAVLPLLNLAVCLAGGG
ncbi:hypothetical protein [Streptomyces cylindrosporus]|uniref:Uncharacterized protein n=1 Tax=Streptomyces cylindrosporus TaxID=2927583 RepID=A0ABS9Y2K2_9ACTN|nr:hypothetical protein [Streptomyces cylindrosporus]MCI3271442.1 hypothetical protein [Streptomyces cylindrosporus]